MQGRIVIPTLIGGVSTQDPAYRQANQVSEAKNFMFSITQGAYKRAPVKEITEITIDDADIIDNLRMHMIDRDDSEMYAIIYGDGVLIAVDLLDGDQVDLSGDAAYSYLSDATADEIKFASAKDTTIIANTTVTPSLTSSSTYNIDGVYRDYDVLLSHNPAISLNDPEVYFRTVEDTLDYPAGHWQHEDLFYALGITFPSAVTTNIDNTTPNWRIITTYQNELYNPMGMTIGTSYRSVSADSCTFTNGTKSLTSSDSSFITYSHPVSGTPMIRITGGTNVVAGWYEIDSKTNNNTVVLVDDITSDASSPTDVEFNGISEPPSGSSITVDPTSSPVTLTATNAFTGYTWTSGDMIRLTGGTNVTPYWYEITAKVSDSELEIGSDPTTDGASHANVEFEGIGIGSEIVVNFAIDTPADLYGVALGFQKAARETVHPDFCIEYSQIFDDSKKFTLAGPFTGYTSHILVDQAISDNVLDIAKTGTLRPFRSPNLTYAGGIGTPSSDRIPIADRWTRVAGPGQEQAIFDVDTMPIKMTRDSIYPLTFSLSTIDWESRLSGDNTSNPAPSIFDEGENIADIAFYRNRFVIAGGEFVIMSRSNDLYNLWIFDADDQGDDDPISDEVRGNNVSNIDNIFTWRGLQIFTKTDMQFSDNEPQNLVPSTYSIRQDTQYNIVENVRPAVTGPVFYFASEFNGITQLQEMLYDEARGSNIANDISSHVETWISGVPRTIAACNVTRTAFALTTDDTDGNVIYVYQPAWKGQDRVMSAWSKLIIDEEHIKILDIGAVGDKLYMLLRYTYSTIDDLLLASLNIGNPTDESGVDEYAYIDFQEELTASTDGGTGFQVTYTGTTLPTMVVLGEDCGSDAGTVITTGFTVNHPTKTLTYAGGYSSAVGNTVYVGSPYESSMELSRPYLRDADNVPSLDGDIKLLKLILSYRDSGRFAVKVEQSGRTDRSMYNTSSVESATGKFDVNIRGKADDAVVTILSDQPHPLRLSGAEWVVSAAGRRRI